MWDEAGMPLSPCKELVNLAKTTLPTLALPGEQLFPNVHRPFQGENSNIIDLR
jgi:hypothetical protein